MPRTPGHSPLFEGNVGESQRRVAAQSFGMRPGSSILTPQAQPDLNQIRAFSQRELAEILIARAKTFVGATKQNWRDAGSYINSPAANSMDIESPNLRINNANQGHVTMGASTFNVRPKVDNSTDLGETALRYKSLYLSNLIAHYKSVATAGWGVPAIYASGRSTGQTAAVASVATYTVGAADGSFLISANVLVTTSTSHSFSVVVDYTDEGNNARSLTMVFWSTTGSSGTLIVHVNAIPFHYNAIRIRAKAATAITVKTSGSSFATVTYNVEASIMQIA